ncbi:MAG TPA: hypothetical protein DCM28_15880 [Phycisphaerales bacterium]|nr:hypothetical protein [Phycisphaerales bacterium]HCD33927.1 hypothetical protein [Phycisphaerales bacterium]|tara:strand:+ start:3243 stop:3740 length:498 start_codon:yes stop_codon:yes gene_type:complete
MNTKIKWEKSGWVMLAMLGVSLTLAQIGCKAVDKFKEPALSPIVVESAQVKLVKQSDEAAQFEVILTITNPNTTPLPLVESTLMLDIDGHGTASTNYLLHRTAPALLSQTVIIPVVIVTSEQVSAGTSWSTKGSITYQPPGEFRKLLTDSNVPLPSAAFDLQGQM